MSSVWDNQPKAKRNAKNCVGNWWNHAEMLKKWCGCGFSVTYLLKEGFEKLALHFFVKKYVVKKCTFRWDSCIRFTRTYKGSHAEKTTCMNIFFIDNIQKNLILFKSQISIPHKVLHSSSHSKIWDELEKFFHKINLSHPLI